jgi:hypothetical protein
LDTVTRTTFASRIDAFRGETLLMPAGRMARYSKTSGNGTVAPVERRWSRTATSPWSSAVGMSKVRKLSLSDK